jgi:hypothetical protein
MSKIKVQSNASGTGVFTVTSPATNTDRTITLPDGTGTLLNSDGDGSSLTNLPAGGVDGITSASSSGTAISIASNNNVGVGIGTPTLIAGTGMHLHSSGSDCRFHISNNTVGGTSGDGAYLFMGSDGTFGIQQKESADMKFYNSGGVVLEIKSDGRGLSQFTAKAWISLNGQAGSGSQIQDSHNVSSTTDNGTGDITITFSNSLANTNYTAAGMVPGNVPTRGGMWISFAYGNTSRTTSYLRVNTGYHSNAEYDGAVYDVNPVTVQVFGD